ncbi:hypothetical protein [Rhizobium sp. TRM95796]|uniref:ribonuclease toxin HepT-like protein n=1 Tax=Rhizobium sp. TRM95796 TaxID=2979862 RepID=UPI0021E7EDF4|nr:hypothetical protein [Rhizobium sp. TRM95796]MCV3765893.1 hypothetical protein [Rhizobium sp. TRM95796]
MQAIFVDLDNDIREIAAEAEMLGLALTTYKLTKNDLAPHMRWLAVSGLASGIEKLYSGCERVMSAIASKIDGNAVARDDGWHTTLLRRMHNAYPGVRDRVLTDDTYRALDGLRAFRHRQRNSYGLSLDPEIVEERVSEALEAFAMFQEEMRRLTSRLDPGAGEAD